MLFFYIPVSLKCMHLFNYCTYSKKYVLGILELPLVLDTTILTEQMQLLGTEICSYACVDHCIIFNFSVTLSGATDSTLS